MLADAKIGSGDSEHERHDDTDPERVRAGQRVEDGGHDRDVCREARQTRPERQENRQQHVREREESDRAETVVAESSVCEDGVAREPSEIDGRSGVRERRISEERSQGMQQCGKGQHHQIGGIDADRSAAQITAGIERRAAFGVQRREQRRGEQKRRERQKEAEALARKTS